MRGRVGALIEIAAGFHPDLTGRENLYLQGAILGMTRPEIVPQAGRRSSSSAGIRDFIDTPVKRYSSGMNARLGFAVAAHVDPDVLLIDEVLAVGDFASSRSATRGWRNSASRARRSCSCRTTCRRSSACATSRVAAPEPPPILGSVSEVAALYASAASAANDPRITVHGFSVHGIGDAAPLRSAVAPGTPPLTVDIEIGANTS